MGATFMPFFERLASRVGAGLALTVLLLLCAAGCGRGTPFDIAPVSGKVTYSDGSLIQADQVIVTFVPQGVEAAGKDAASAASGEVNVADGTFPGLTTRTHHDGAIAGRHKVVVLPLKIGPAGVGEPTGAVPARYTNVATTPLEVEVPRGGKRGMHLQIERNP
ncbi:MAG: hypothetical protein RBS80_24920 [Thermoguttaceae bacterium]|jgi:hypothetical protein|nr:hypothetical protein [Thermoguttaceae bacterium]